MSLPNALILGFPKCGTTALVHYLKCYPNINANFKELNYFNDDNFGKIPYDFDPRYINVDKSPTLIYSQKNIQRIRETLEDTHIILCVRNPIDRFFSDYYFTSKKTSLPGFNEPTSPQILKLIRQSQYWYWLEMLQSIWGNENIHILKQEELYSDPNKVVNDLVLKCFGLPPCHLWKKNVNRSAAYAQHEAFKKYLQGFFWEPNEKFRQMTGIDYNG